MASPSKSRLSNFSASEPGATGATGATGAMGAAGAIGAVGATGAGLTAATQAQISATTPGDIRYRDKRLVILYFDMTAMGGGDQMRAFAAAQKFIGTMDASVLMAIMAFQGGAVRVKTDFTDNRALLDEQISAADLRRRSRRRWLARQPRDGNGVRAGRCGVQYFQHGSTAVGPADRHVDAAAAARAEIAGVFLERPAAERHRQPRPAACDDECGVAGQCLHSCDRRARARRAGAARRRVESRRPVACRCSPVRAR